MKFGIFLNKYYTSESELEATELYEPAELIGCVKLDGVTFSDRYIHHEEFADLMTALSATCYQESEINPFGKEVMAVSQ